MTKKSNKCHSIIFTRNTYTEEQNIVFWKVLLQIVMIDFEQPYKHDFRPWLKL